MANHGGLYRNFREDQFHPVRGEGNPAEMDGIIAGVPNAARCSQPDMFSILSWVGDAPRSPPDSAGPSPWPAREVKKEKVFNRWMTESQDQFAWANKVVPAENPANTTTSENDDPQTNPVPGDAALPVPPIGALDTKAASIKKAITTEQKQRKRLLRAKRANAEAAAKTNTSRDMADTAHAEVYRRPAFHNYGRSSSVIPGANTTVAEHLITHNAKAPKEAKWAAPRFEAKLSKKEAPPPSSASYDYATKKSARKSTVPRRSSGGSPAVSESGAGGASAPPSPTPQSTSEEATAAAGVPSARSEEGAVEAAVGGGVGGGAWGLPRRLGGSQGYANHKRAARVPAGPPQGLAPPPQLASAMGTARSNDPKTYKSVPHEWTCMIVPAGTPNTHGVSVSDCLDIFE